MAKLLIISAGFSNRVINLKLGVNRFGRSAKNDFVIEHSTVSAEHCEIELGGNELVLRDCHSTNSTMVDGLAITEAPLKVGQKISIGDVDLMVESVEAQVAIPQYEPLEDHPAMPAVRSGSQPVCPKHSATPATYQCNHCQKFMCDLCVHRHRRTGGRMHYFCPYCSHSCSPIKSAPRTAKSILQMLSTTLRLPFHSGPKTK